MKQHFDIFANLLNEMNYELQLHVCILKYTEFISSRLTTVNRLA